MNYFYFFFFLTLSVLILLKPLMNIIGNWVLGSSDLKKMGVFTFLIGCICIYFGTSSEYWNERVWTITTFALGILLVIRGFFIIFFLDFVKKGVTFYMNNYYKISIPVSLFFICLSFLIVLSDYIGPQKDISSCKPDIEMQLVCGFKNPEDIVITPDENYLLMSEMGGVGPYVEIEPGFFALMDLKTNKRIIPEISIEENQWGDSKCERTISDKYGPHGIDLVKRNDGRYQLGVISHYPNETVEMFELQKENNAWKLFWRGCIDVPENLYFNDISLQKDGSFYATHMYERGITMNKWLITSLLKSNSGYLVKWQANSFSMVPNSEGSGPNGIALEESKNIIYISYNQGDSLTAFDLETNTKINSIFIQSPDNPFIKDESVWITALDFQPKDAGDCADRVACSLPFSIHELDKKTLQSKSVYSYSKTVFGLPTVAVPIDENIYIGSFHSDRLGVIRQK